MLNFKDKWRMFLFMLITFLLSTDSVSAQNQPSVDVSIQRYSGRLNPGWIVNDPNEIAQLRGFIDGLPSTEPVDPSIFGGFLLASNEAISKFPQTVLVFNGVIEVSKADGTAQAFQDTKGLRAFLVSQAIAHGICPDSDLRGTVVISGCDSTVRNALVSDSCTISDQVIKCTQNARNHGQFVSCVSGLTNDLKKNGTISDNDKGQIQSCAAKANIP